VSEQQENWKSVLEEMKKQKAGYEADLRLMIDAGAPNGAADIAVRLVAVERVIAEIEKEVNDAPDR
jgi:hypothetical protein